MKTIKTAIEAALTSGELKEAPRFN